MDNNNVITENRHMKNQFFYTRKDQAGDEFLDSFNLDKVIRSISYPDEVLVLLDDLHERSETVPVYNKAGKITAYKKEKNTYQSEIHLSKEDGERFYKLTNIEL